jgi:exonuclease III
VYTPVSDSGKKAHFYNKLTEWAKNLKGEILLGGDWNMTICQKDQRLKRYNRRKNLPLHELDHELGTKDVWRKLHRGEPGEYTWKRGEGETQEKRLDGFRTDVTDLHVSCNNHKRPSFTTDHIPVETV